jgi:myo-inositol-1(or 4)-monophosphatase
MANEYLNAAIETALEAGKILREEYALPPDIRYKGDVDLVTQADRRSEQAIVERLFAAARGQGATLNDKKIAVSQVATLSTSLLCTGFPVQKRRSNPNIHYYYDFTLRSHGVRRDGSAALDLASVAAGRFDGFWEFGLNAWDTAAGVLLVEEAGGAISDFHGAPYRLGGPVVLATNGLIHEEMRAAALAISQRDPNAPLQAPLQHVQK